MAGGILEQVIGLQHDGGKEGVLVMMMLINDYYVQGLAHITLLYSVNGSIS